MLASILLGALVVLALVELTASSELLKPLRQMVEKWSVDFDGNRVMYLIRHPVQYRLKEFFGTLVGCPVCQSYWHGLAISWAIPSGLHGTVGWFLTWLAIVGMTRLLIRALRPPMQAANAQSSSVADILKRFG
jgi:hypothetical protein